MNSQRRLGIGSIVIISKGQLDQTGDDNDPAIVNTVRIARTKEEQAAKDASATFPDTGAGVKARLDSENPDAVNPEDKPAVPASMPPAPAPTKLTANADGSITARPPKEPVPPYAYLSATIFPESAHIRFVRDVPFFASREEADLWPRGTASPSNPHAGHVAYWPADEDDDAVAGRVFGPYDDDEYGLAPSAIMPDGSIQVSQPSPAVPTK